MGRFRVVLISKHSKYFETFCRNIVKLELISDFICIFAHVQAYLSLRQLADEEIIYIFRP